MARGRGHTQDGQEDLREERARDRGTFILAGATPPPGGPFTWKCAGCQREIARGKTWPLDCLICGICVEAERQAAAGRTGKEKR